MKKLNLGCGKDIRKGFVNVDQHKMKGVDVAHNLDKFPYPFKTNTFDFILCSHVIEHLNDWIKCLKELHRISKNRGIIEIQVPHFASLAAFVDPTHKHIFSLEEFGYFTKKHTHDYYFNFKFDIIYKEITFPRGLFLLKGLFNKYSGFYETNLCYIFRPHEIIIKLKVIK